MRRAWVAAATLALVVGSGAAGVALDRVRLSEPRRTEPVAAPLTARVERGAVTQDVVVRLSRVPEWTGEVLVAPPEQGRMVVTAVLAREGRPLRPCTIIAKVNDRAVLVLPGELPAYRSLRVGDVGSDVVQLQQALARCGHRPEDPEGTFGAPTLAAARAVLDDDSIEAVDWRALTYVPSRALPATITELRLRVGQVLDAAEPVVRVASVRSRYSGRVGAADAESLVVGKRVALRGESGKTAWGTILAVERTGARPGAAPVGPGAGATGDQPAGDAASPASWTVHVRSEAATLGSGATGTVRLRASPSRHLRVPLAALRDGATGMEVVVVPGDGRQRTVVVTVGLVGAGYAAIDPARNAGLRAGDTVLLHGD